MRTKTDFSGLWIPLITPFIDGKVDLLAITKLVRQLREAGIAGVVVCGSTGEAAALDTSEQLDVLTTTLAAAPGLPVVMGVSGYHLPHMLAWVDKLASFPLAGLLVPAPYYIRPSQAGLLSWFHAIADTSAVPLIVYDIPYRTGVVLDRSTLLELALHPRIQAVKDCGGELAKTLALISQGRLQVLAGEDLQMFATVAQGGAGAIAASAHIGTAQFVRLLQLLQAGDMAQARLLWTRLVPLVEAVFAEPNPAPVKAMLAQLGLVRNELRAPMVPASAAHAERLAVLLQQFA